MSRGLGRLQRALLVELEKRESWTTAIELMMATSGSESGIYSRAHDVAVRRALHGLYKRKLVGLQHHGLRHFKSDFLGRNVLIQAEVLVAWLPGQTQAPPHGWHGALNPKRCVRNQVVDDATLTAEQLEQRSAELQQLEAVISKGMGSAERCPPRESGTTQHIEQPPSNTQSSPIRLEGHEIAPSVDHRDHERPSAAGDIE